MVLEKSFRKRILVVGGGYAGVCAIVELMHLIARKKLEQQVEVILVDPHDYMQTLSEFDLIAATNSSRNAEFCKLSYSELFRKVPWGSFKHIKSSMTSLSHSDKKITLADGQELEYWRLVIAVGAQPFFPPIPGLEKYSVPVWSMDNISDIHDRATELMELALHEEDEQKRRELLTFTVVGGGDTGVEVVGTFGHRLPLVAKRFGLDPEEVTIRLVEARDTILLSMPDMLRQKAERHMKDTLGIEILKGTPLAEVKKDSIVLGEKTLPSALTIWAGGVRAASCLKEWGFETDKMGRINTDAFLKSEDDENIYVIGDAARVEWPEKNGTLYMVAQFAVPEGPHAARNIIAEMEGLPITKFKPNHRGEFVSVGDYCVGTAFGHAVSGLPAMFIKRFTYVEYWWQARGTWFAFKRIIKMLKLMYGR